MSATYLTLEQVAQLFFHPILHFQSLLYFLAVVPLCGDLLHQDVLVRVPILELHFSRGRGWRHGLVLGRKWHMKDNRIVISHRCDELWTINRHNNVWNNRLFKQITYYKLNIQFILNCSIKSIQSSDDPDIPYCNFFLFSNYPISIYFFLATSASCIEKKKTDWIGYCYFAVIYTSLSHRVSLLHKKQLPQSSILHIQLVNLNRYVFIYNLTAERQQ